MTQRHQSRELPLMTTRQRRTATRWEKEKGVTSTMPSPRVKSSRQRKDSWTGPHQAHSKSDPHPVVSSSLMDWLQATAIRNCVHSLMGMGRELATLQSRLKGWGTDQQPRRRVQVIVARKRVPDPRTRVPDSRKQGLLAQQPGLKKYLLQVLHVVAAKASSVRGLSQIPAQREIADEVHDPSDS